MVRHIEALLAGSSGPMSFSVIVPAWTDDAHWPIVTGSRFNRGSVVVAAPDHR
jgi:hypothetical protein